MPLCIAHHVSDDRQAAEPRPLVAGPWRHEEIPDASHWVPVDAPGKLNELLVSWLR